MYASLRETLQSEEANQERMIKNIKDLAQQLYNNVSEMLHEQSHQSLATGGFPAVNMF